MVSKHQRTWKKRIALTVLVLASTVMASDAPPATLPRGFLEQIPLLMQLNEKEFEQLVKFAQENPTGDPTTNKQSTTQAPEDSNNNELRKQHEN